MNILEIFSSTNPIKILKVKEKNEGLVFFKKLNWSYNKDIMVIVLLVRY